MITAIVNGNGTFYKDGTERLYLHVNKNEGHGLPYKDDEQVPITLVVGGTEYSGRLGARSDYPYIYVATELCDLNGVAHKQTQVLHARGLSKGDQFDSRCPGTGSSWCRPPHPTRGGSSM
jgi:hypothetical protein